LWVNRKDWSRNNLYEGGFLGLGNIGVFDQIDAQTILQGGLATALEKAK
jgi:hypothetical protein